MRLTTFIATAAITAVCGFALAAEMPSAIKMSNGMLTDDHGMTLYTFDNDKAADKSACNGMCSVNWPPLKAAADARNMGEYGVITRDDGSKQWAFKGKPLYFWHLDKKAGDTDGDGKGQGMVWHIARP